MEQSSRVLFQLRCTVTIVFVLGIFLWFSGAARQQPIESFFTLTQYDDSWKPMMKAVEYLKHGCPEGPLYKHLFFEKEIRFLYPPTSLIVPYALSYFPVHVPQILRGLNFLFILGLVFFLVKIFWRLYDVGKEKWPVVTGLFVITIFFYPVMWAYHVGQMQAWINTAFAGLIYFYIKEDYRAAGICAGLMCLIKPYWALLLVWGMIRGKKEFVVSLAATIGIALALSIALFGLANHFDYLSVLNDISRHGAIFYSNQSVNGFLNRLANNGDATALLRVEYDNIPYHAFVYFGTLIGAVIFTAAALVIPNSSPKKGGAIDLSIMAITLTLVSPTAWDHYYGILLPVFVLVFPLFWKVRGNPWLIPLIISYILCSHSFQRLDLIGNIPGWNVFTSYRFIGVLILLGVLYGLLGKSPREQSCN